MKVYVIELGKLGIDKNLMLSRAVVANADEPNRRLEWIELPVWGLFIDTGDHKIIYDLGCLPDAMETGWDIALQKQMPITRTEDQYIDKQLAKLGYTPEDIDTVILSHFHADHFGAIAQFTHCDVYVPKEDWQNALMKAHETASIYSGGTYSRKCLDLPVKKYHPIEKNDDFELFPGLEIITLPGHVANLLGLVIHLEKDGVQIYPSDAMAMAETYEYDAAPSRTYNPNDWDNSIKKIRRLEKKYNAKVFISHSMEWFNTYKKIPEYYE